MIRIVPKLRLAALAVLALLPASAALPNIFDDRGIDPRFIQPQVGDSAIYGPVVRLQTDVVVSSKEGDEESYFTGTGFLVSPCLVMTNAHVVTDDAGEVTRIAVRVVTGEGFETREINGTVEAIGGYAETSLVRDDWAVVRLAECVGTELGWFDFANLTTEALLDSVVAEAGFPGDRDAEVMWLEPDCRLFPATDFSDRNGFYHDCASTPGSSGSPVYLVTEAGPRVIGIDEGEYRGSTDVIVEYTDSRANIAVDIRHVLRAAGAVIKADRVGVANPLDQIGWPGEFGTDLGSALAGELVRHGCMAEPDVDPRSLQQGAAQFSLVTSQDAPEGEIEDAEANWFRLLDVMRYLPGPACTERAIAPLDFDVPTDGALGLADNVDRFETFADCYVLSVPAGAQKFPVTVDLTLQSKTFDAYLEIGQYVSDRNCGTVELEHFNDDEADGNTNSRIVVDLKPSVYLVRVTSLNPGETGGYVLTVQ